MASCTTVHTPLFAYWATTLYGYRKLPKVLVCDVHEQFSTDKHAG